MNQPDALQPWDRRASETPKAFQMFTIYRDLGPQRSLRAVAREASFTLRLIAGWSSEHDWVDRAAAWDAENDRLRQAETKAGIIQMAKDHVSVGRQMLAKAALALQKIDIDVTKLTPREIATLAELGARLQRIGYGQAEQTVQVTGKLEVTGPTGAQILKALAANPDLIDFADRLDEALEATFADIG